MNLSLKIIALATLATFFAGCETGTKNTTKAGKAVCKVDSDCSDGNLCVDNYCAESAATCSYNFDCATNENCESGVCVSINEPVTEDECTTDDDCTSGYTCDTSASPKKCILTEIDPIEPNPANECTENSDCSENESCTDNNGAMKCVNEFVTETRPTFDFSGIDPKNIDCKERAEWNIRALNSNIASFDWIVENLPSDIQVQKYEEKITFIRNAGDCLNSDQNFDVIVKASSKANPANTFDANFSMTIKGLEDIALKNSECQFVLGVYGNCQLVATGGYNTNYEFDILGSMPDGFFFDKNNGKITGAPTDLTEKIIKLRITSGDMPAVEKPLKIIVVEKISISAWKNVDCIGGFKKIDSLHQQTIEKFAPTSSCVDNKPKNGARKAKNTLYLYYPKVEGASYSWSSNNMMFDVIDSKYGVYVEPNELYDGSRQNVTFFVRKANSDIANSISFNDLKFEDYPCKEPEIFFEQNGNEIEQLNVLPGQSIKDIKIKLSGSWAISKIDSNIITFKTEHGIFPRSTALDISYDNGEKDFSIFADSDARVEFPRPDVEPYLNVHIKKDSCQPITKNVKLNIASMSKGEKLKYFIVETGLIADTGNGSYFQFILHGPNDVKFTSEQLHVEGRDIDNSTFAVDEWENGSGKKMRIPNIDIDDIKQIEVRIHDGDGINDLRLNIKQITLLSKSYFAIMNQNIGGSISSLKVYDLRLGCTQDSACNKIAGATEKYFAKDYFYKSGYDTGDYRVESEDGLFQRSNIRKNRQIFVHQELNLGNKSEGSRRVFLYGGAMLFTGGEFVDLTKADDDGDDWYSNTNDELKTLINCWHSDNKMPACTYSKGDNICTNDGNATVCNKSTEVAY